MRRLRAIEKDSDIPAVYSKGPIGDLIRFHNLDAPLREVKKAEILIGMCMDSRKTLRLPANFAFILRTGGATLRQNEFKVSYVVSVGGVRHLALIGHTDCAMVGLASREKPFVEGLMDVGWERSHAEEHFRRFAPQFEIKGAVDFTYSETKRLRMLYPGLTVAPLIYRISDNKLYLLQE